jgi:hypothetical protein
MDDHVLGLAFWVEKILLAIYQAWDGIRQNSVTLKVSQVTVRVWPQVSSLAYIANRVTCTFSNLKVIESQN